MDVLTVKLLDFYLLIKCYVVIIGSQS